MQGAKGAFGTGLATDGNSNIYLTGGFADNSINFGAATINQTYPSPGKLALFLVQYLSGDVVTWSKTIGSQTRDVWGFSIALASCGQVWVSGNYTQDANIDGNILSLVPGNDPIFIAGYNLSGGVVGYSGLGSGGDDQNGIASDAAGNIYVCSDYEISSGTNFTIGSDVLPYGNLETFYMAKFATTAPDTVFTHQSSMISCSVTATTLAAPVGILPTTGTMEAFFLHAQLRGRVLTGFIILLAGLPFWPIPSISPQQLMTRVIVIKTQAHV